MWMKLFGHTCLKRTLLWSTSQALTRLSLGQIVKKLHRSKLQVVDKKRNKKGQLTWTGNKHLKGTQPL